MDLVFSRTKKIPNKNFGRECCLCSSRHGVPIECSARGCKAAYHTTCAIRGKLKMQAIFGKNFKGGIKLRSYCKQHSPSVDLENGLSSQADKIDSTGVKEIDMTNLADDRLHDASEELDYFWKYVDINEVHKKISDDYSRMVRIKLEPSTDDATDDKEHTSPTSPKKKKIKLLKSETPTKIKQKKLKLKDAEGTKQDDLLTYGSADIDPLALDLIHRYWMLLRTANNGQSLIKFSPSALKEREFEQRKSIMKLRIELERVRNLSYMIGKREKLKASWLKAHQNIIKRTFNIINDLNPVADTQPMIESSSLSDPTAAAAATTNHQQNQAQVTNYCPTTGLITNGKKSLYQTQHIQPTNGMFDESDQLINDLITCDQIYELPNCYTNTNYSNLSHQELSTLERRRTLSLVRRINRQLKSVCVEHPPLNPYAKNYLTTSSVKDKVAAAKRSDSPVSSRQTVLKPR